MEISVFAKMATTKHSNLFACPANSSVRLVSTMLLRALHAVATGKPLPNVFALTATSMIIQMISANSALNIARLVTTMVA